MADPIIEYLKTVDGPTLCNAIELLKCRPHHEGFTPLDVRCLFPQFGRMAGYAVTAQVETVTQCEPLDLQQFVALYRLVERTPKPAVIAFQEVGAHPDYAAHCGEVMSTVFTRLGAIGLLSDCAVRDIPEVRNLGFHYFARGTVASHAHFRIVRVGVTIQVLGMVVKPGQILYGDENGVLTIPDGTQERLAAAVDQIRSREQKLMNFVRSGEFSLDRFGEFVAE